MTKAELDKLIEDEVIKSIPFPKKHTDGCYQTIMLYEANDFIEDAFKSGAEFVAEKLLKEIERIEELTSELSKLKVQADRHREALEYYANRMGMGGTAREALKGE